METILVVGLGGFAGAVARYAVSRWAAVAWGERFPWGTLVINVSGSFGLALLIGYAANHTAMDARLRLFLAVGFFGAYTTFSTFATESVGLMRADAWAGALGHLLGTNALCLLAAWVGLALGSKL